MKKTVSPDGINFKESVVALPGKLKTVMTVGALLIANALTAQSSGDCDTIYVQGIWFKQFKPTEADWQEIEDKLNMSLMNSEKEKVAKIIPHTEFDITDPAIQAYFTETDFDMLTMGQRLVGHTTDLRDGAKETAQNGKETVGGDVDLRATPGNRMTGVGGYAKTGHVGSENNNNLENASAVFRFYKDANGITDKSVRIAVHEFFHIFTDDHNHAHAMEHFESTGQKTVLYPNDDPEIEFMLDDMNKQQFDTIASYALPTNPERDREDCEMTTGTEDGDVIAQHMSDAYPNPVASGENVHVNIHPNLMSIIKSVSIHDINGRRMLDVPVDAQGVTIPTTNMPSGVYVIHATTKQGKMHSAKLIVQ